MNSFDYRTLRGDTAEVLGGLAHPSVGLALWHRPLPPIAPADLLRLASSELDFVFQANRDDPGSLAAALTAVPQLVPDAASEGLARDIRGLALLFGTVSGSRRIQVRLQAVRSDACCRFHADACALRLLTTYTGEPTQIVPSKYSVQALDAQATFDGPYVEVPPGTVCVLRGRQSGFGGVVHRSPPFFPGSSTPRLVLCLTSRTD